MKKKFIFNRITAFFISFCVVVVVCSIPVFAVLPVPDLDFTINVPTGVGTKVYRGFYASGASSLEDGVYNYQSYFAGAELSYIDFAIFVPSDFNPFATILNPSPARSAFQVVCKLLGITVDWSSYSSFESFVNAWYDGVYIYFETPDPNFVGPLESGFFSRFLDSLYYGYAWSDKYYSRSGVVPDSSSHFLFLYSDTLCDMFMTATSRVFSDCFEYLSKDNNKLDPSSTYDLLVSSSFNSLGSLDHFTSSSDFSLYFYHSVDYGMMSTGFHYPFYYSYSFNDTMTYALDSRNWNWLPPSVMTSILAFLGAVVGVGSIYGIRKLF